jgi:hypothetical protein
MEEEQYDLCLLETKENREILQTRQTVSGLKMEHKESDF